MHESHLFHTSHHGFTNDHEVDGKVVSTSVKNPSGGDDYFHNGHLDVRTIPNSMGGVDLLDGHHVVHSVPNALGGHDYIYDNGHYGSSLPNQFGGSEVYIDGHLAASSIPMSEGFSIVMSHADPLTHVEQYNVDALHLTALGLDGTEI
jgi:hypothetical protein